MELPQIPGIRFTRSLIYRRPLQLAHSLCWRPGNLGLVPNARGFSWNSALSELDGRKRAAAVRKHWVKMEETFNVLLDTAFQAYRDDLASALTQLLDVPIQGLEHLDLVVDPKIKSHVGRPDTVLLDPESRSLIFIEIKLSARYTFDQHLKYLTLDVLADGYKTYNLLLSHKPTYLKSSRGMGKCAKSDTEYGRVDLRHSSSVAAEVGRRARAVTNGSSRTIALERYPFFFASWDSFAKRLPNGLLRENVIDLVQEATTAD